MLSKETESNFLAEHDKVESVQTVENDGNFVVHPPKRSPQYRKMMNERHHSLSNVFGIEFSLHRC